MNDLKDLIRGVHFEFPGFTFARAWSHRICFTTRQNERCTLTCTTDIARIESQSAETFLARRKCITTEQDRVLWFRMVFRNAIPYTHQRLGALSPAARAFATRTSSQLKNDRLKVWRSGPIPFGGIDSDPRHIPLFHGRKMATRSRGSRLTLRQTICCVLVAQPQTND